MISKKSQLKQELTIWPLLGPLLITLITALYLFRTSFQEATVPLLGILGMVSIWRFRMVGLAFSLSTLLAILFFTFSSLPPGERFWSLGITMSLGLAFVVMALCFEEMESLLGGLEEETGEGFQKLSRLDAELREKELLFASEKSKWISEIEWEKNRLKGLEREIEALKVASLEQKAAFSKELQSKEERLFTLEKEVEKRGEALLDAKELIKSLEEAQALQLEQLASVEPTLTERDAFEPLYLQLREQFKEKNALLAATRKELFHISEAYASLQRELHERSCFQESEEESRLIRQIVKMQSEMEHKEAAFRQEIAELESIIANLSRESVLQLLTQ